MGGVAIEMRVVLIEFGVVFIGGWGYLTLLLYQAEVDFAQAAFTFIHTTRLGMITNG